MQRLDAAQASRVPLRTYPERDQRRGIVSERCGDAAMRRSRDPAIPRATLLRASVESLQATRP
jgi:hypothetical protein